ncbi:MAG: glycine dehydrogenase (aminomethyl-transferring), partial [Candidatus Marinimicrobia bacterium]|nr:glycine dehydrogenase (aminomethyl-transferring) [Candidatus Neomarinimicrobiota bacterium]
KLNKNKNKKFIIVPETAHGTNPASVILAGFEVLEVGTSNFGTIDMEDLRSKLTDEVAGIMLTQPNTLGVFEKDIKEISRLIHGVDGLLYMDGANLNAMVGLCKPSDMGFDIIHMNLHKTFSTPHGGGGPGAGPIGVTKKLKDFLPSPIINKNANNSYYLDYSSHHSIGKIHSFYGNVGVLLRAYCYIKSYGDNLKDISKNAIINANYIKKNLSEYYNIPFYDGTMHEFVISALNQKKRGLKALDIAKVLLDYGFHAPTIYFPINVQEAIMIEPTETESKEKLDEFIKFMIYIDQNLDSKLEDFLTCPKNTPVKRVNEVKANRDLDLSWNNEI